MRSTMFLVALFFGAHASLAQIQTPKIELLHALKNEKHIVLQFSIQNLPSLECLSVTIRFTDGSLGKISCVFSSGRRKDDPEWWVLGNNCVAETMLIKSSNRLKRKLVSMDINNSKLEIHFSKRLLKAGLPKSMDVQGSLGEKDELSYHIGEDFFLAE